MNRVKKLLLPLGISIALIGHGQARAQGVTNTTFPISFSVFVPCANGGEGEMVVLTGTLHDSFDVRIDSDGVRVDVHDNPQGITGTGLTTGDKYQATGVTRWNLAASSAIDLVFVDNFRIIGQGPGNNFLFHDNLHLSIDSDGRVTAFHDNLRADCK